MARMRTVNLDLHFGWREGAVARQGKMAQIYVKGTYGHGISRPCGSFGELEMEIARLQKELEGLLAKGRKRFSQLRVA